MFSGGVESVALLSLAKKGDRLLLIEPWQTGQVAYIKKKIDVIVDYYNLPAERFSFTGKVRCPQMILLLSAATARVFDDDSITEVWHGMHSGDITSSNENTFSRMCAAWEILSPNKPLRMPLRHETKMQQWSRIPDILKPYVHTCIHETVCGVCAKCKERQMAGIPN